MRISETLSPQRAKALAFIKAECASGRGFPTRREIANHMGWRHVGSGVLDVLHALHRRGYLDREWMVDGWKFSLKEAAHVE